MNNKRLVYVWNYLSWGGAQIYFLAIMKIARAEWDILVILPEKSSPEIVRYLSELGISYKFVPYHLDFDPAPSIGRKIERQRTRLKVEYRTYRELQAFDVRDTIFHIETAPWQSVAFLTAMSMRGAKFFVTLHNFLPDAPSWRKALWKSRLRFVSYLPGLNFFASNNDTKNRLRGWVNDRFWERIRVTFTAVNPPQIAEAAEAAFDLEETRRRIGIRENDFVVLCVGQFIDRKGRWIFLEAAREVVSSADDISFVWLSPTRPTAEEEKRISDFGLGDKFRLVLSETLGNDRLDVLKFFRVADAFALPSYVEGLPIALLEAMALEIAAISTDVYAIPEAVKNLETGILIQPGDSNALANAILTLKNDDELRRQLAKSGREFVLKHFDERDAARTVIEAYEEALADD